MDEATGEQREDVPSRPGAGVSGSGVRAAGQGRSRRRLGVPQVRKPGSPRTIVHKVKVTEDQERRLVARAAERDVTVSRLLVESALAGGADNARVRAELIGELFRITRLLGKVSVNINQIARATNATLERQPETGPAIGALGRVCERLGRLLDDVDRPAVGSAGSGRGVGGGGVS